MHLLPQEPCIPKNLAYLTPGCCQRLFPNACLAPGAMHSKETSARRTSISRPSAQNGTSQRVVTAQKRQQALCNCLDLCESLGFHPEAEQLGSANTATSGSTAATVAQEVCQLLDSADKLCAMQAEADVSRNASLFGNLLHLDDLKTRVRTADHAYLKRHFSKVTKSTLLHSA